MIKPRRTAAPGRGYAKKDWDAIDSPEMTEAELASMKPAREVLPTELYNALVKRKPGQRGPQKIPTKLLVTLRLDRDIVERFKATGAGWQTRMNEALRRSKAR